MKLIKAIQKVAFLTAIVFSALLKNGNAQFVNNGTTVTVTSGAILFAGSSLTNNVNGIIINEGSINTDSNIINNDGASISGNGIYIIQGNFTNDGSFEEGTSTLEFTGAGNSSVKNKSGSIYTLQVSKNANTFVNLLNNEKILNSVVFLNDKNWIKLGNKTLTLAANCTIVNYSNKRYFVTNGTGTLKKLNLDNTPFTFPVGFDKSTYNALTITENGTADAYLVRCLENALLDGSSGNPISSKGIDASWFIEEAIAGGANAIIQAEWKNTDELTDFDYTHCMAVRYTATGWDFKNNQAGTAVGNVYRSIARSGFSSFGYFTVLSSATPTFADIAVVDAESAFANTGSQSTGLRVYPTIIQNNINIDVPSANKIVQKMNISVIDGNGKAVWQKQNADYASQKLFLPNLPSGIYNLVIESGDNRFVQKIIIGK